MRRFILAIFVLAILSVAPRADAQQACFGPTCPGGGGTTTIVSGTTPITGGADTQLCFNDGGFAACGDAGLIYAKATDILTMLGGATVGSVTTAGRATLNLRDTITGASAASNFLSVTGTFPGTLSAETTGALFAFTVDNDGQTQSGLKATIAGAGGSVDTAIRGAASNTGTYSVGVMGETSGVATNAVGVFGYAAAGTNRVGGYFDLGTNVPAPPSSVGLYVNNSAVAAPIFIAADNGTAVFTIADGGTVTVGAGANFTSNGANLNSLTNVNSAAHSSTPSTGGSGYGFKDSATFRINGNTSLTPDAVTLGLNATGNSFHVVEDADFTAAYDFNNGACGTSACTDPGLIIHSAAQDTTQYNHNAVWGTAGGAIKTLTESAATSVVRIPIANLAGAFGKFCYTVKAADATDSQIRGSCIKYTVTAKAGTETCSLNTEAALTSDASITETEDGSGSGAITTGTLTYAITCDVTPANAVDIQINAVSSLTQTTLNVQYNLNHVGPGQPARQ